eukprot:PhF_6_TR40464/c0_g2_i2/m.60475
MGAGCCSCFHFIGYRGIRDPMKESLTPSNHLTADTTELVEGVNTRQNTDETAVTTPSVNVCITPVLHPQDITLAFAGESPSLTHDSSGETQASPDSEDMQHHSNNSDLDETESCATDHTDTIGSGTPPRSPKPCWALLMPKTNHGLTPQFYIGTDTFVVGRGSSCDGVLNTQFKTISQKHFIIRRHRTRNTRDTEVELEDCSSNGTIVHGARCE